tara:strand:- start:165 stop:602 length:438 start_codon:yes stop_codon:yes gene_type:complete
MIKIAHRGNILGITEKENQPDYIDAAIRVGYDVEIDVRAFNDNTVWLGHDKPTYEINFSYLMDRKDRLWCHAKNLEALYLMMDREINCFWQEDDSFAITSSGYIFTHSKMTEWYQRTDKSILVSLDGTLDAFGSAGICSDYIGKY